MDTLNILLSILLLLLAMFLSILSYIDCKSYRLPDALTLTLIVLGLVQSHLLFQAIIPSLLGVFFGYSSFTIINYGYKRLRSRDGLGRGDAKLFAAGGAWCGVYYLPVIALIASLLGIVAVLKTTSKENNLNEIIPFGPFLSIGIISSYVILITKSSGWNI